MVEELRLLLLGGLHLSRCGVPVTGFVSSKVPALLCYLAVTGRPHMRAELAGLLWGELPDAAASANLRQALCNLRHLLAPYLLITPQTVEFNRNSPYWLDVEVLQSRSNPRAAWSDADIDLLGKAVEHYRGEFLQGFHVRDALAFEEWVLGQREHWRQIALQALHTLAAHFTAQDNVAEAVRYSTRLLALEPWQELAHRQMMQLLALSGQRNAALAQYDACRRVLAQELGVEPEEETTALYERIRDGDQETKRQEARLHNLPAQLTAFVGREAELDVMKACLRDPGCRLLTLVGPGGCGKTRLALEAAANILPENCFSDGIFFVSLAPLQTVDAIVPAVAQALNFTFYKEGEPRRQLLDYLRRKYVLLILDGFEHLLDGVGLVTEILNTAPDVKVVVTSRAALNVSCEHLLSVAGMAYPAQIPTTAKELQAYAAVELFLQGARRARGHFKPTLDDLRRAAQVCRMVEGIPLAVLLAAAWSKILSLAEIAQQIGQGIDFLEMDWRDVPERQRSMRAVFDHSWRLLNERERQTFRELGVFRGGFTGEAACHVAGASPGDLAALVNQSLLHRASSERYEMHELLRQYAAEKLDQNQDAGETTRDRYCAYYVAALHKWAADLRGPRQQTALAEIGLDLENAHAAWSRALERGQVERLDQAIEGLCLFYERRGRYRDGETTCWAAAERVKAEVSGNGLRVQSKALAWQSVFTEKLGQLEPAGQLARQSLAILDDPALAGTETRPERAFALKQLAKSVVHFDMGEALRLGEQSLALYQALDERWMMANVLDDLSFGAAFAGASDKARQCSENSLTIRQALGDQRGIASTLESLGFNLLRQGQFEEAERLIRESVQQRWKMDDRAGIAQGLFNLGEALNWSGKYTEAQPLLLEAIALYKDLGNHVEAGKAYVCLGGAQGMLGLYKQARATTQTGLALLQESGSQRELSIAYWTLGFGALAEEAYSQAQQWLQESAALLQDIGAQELLIAVYAGLGYTARGLGQRSQAEQYLAEAVRIASQLHAGDTPLFLLPLSALLSCDEGRAEQAVELYALASRYPGVANSRWCEDVAGQHVAAAAASLPPDVVAAAQERGRNRDLVATVVELSALGTTESLKPH